MDGEVLYGTELLSVLIFHLHLKFELKCCKHGLEDVQVIAVHHDTYFTKITKHNSLNNFVVQETLTYNIGTVHCVLLQHYFLTL